jgi:cation diffusion facilitator family transporter
MKALRENPETTSACTHRHRFDTGNIAAERSTRAVMIITAVTMVVEIVAGWRFNSMALLADGWHMSSHAIALGLSTLAYATARRYALDPRFAFGTWKIEVLAGFASAMFLIFVAGSMVFGSVERLVSPQSIHFIEAIVVAVLGLAVNLGCALILGGTHHHDDHDHGHHDDHEHDHHHHDLNLKSAYVHVVADAATSVLAIVALLGGMLMGWTWLDPVMGLVGAALVAIWAVGLIRQSGRVLIDAEMDHPVVASIRDTIQSISGAPTITDLHVWRVGKQSHAVILSLLTDDADLTPAQVKQRLAQHGELAHISIEINRRPAT